MELTPLTDLSEIKPPFCLYQRWLDWHTSLSKNLPFSTHDLLAAIHPDLDTKKVEYDSRIYNGNFLHRASQFFRENSMPKALEWGDLKYYLKLADLKLSHLILREINWTPGDYGEKPTSCWWGYPQESRGRLRFWHEARKGNAGAVVLGDGCSSGRVFFIQAENFVALFNAYGFNMRFFVRAAMKIFPQYDVAIDSHSLSLNNDIYLNGPCVFLSSSKEEPVCQYYYRHWSDYLFNDMEMEMDRIHHLHKLNGESVITYCEICGMPLYRDERCWREDWHYAIRQHISAE